VIHTPTEEVAERRHGRVADREARDEARTDPVRAQAECGAIASIMSSLFARHVRPGSRA
jgi:hypothetical protein